MKIFNIGPASRAVLATACMFVAFGQVVAQPTGNPAGTAAPDVRGQAVKTPATRTPNATGEQNDQHKAPVQRSGPSTNPDNPAARSGHSRTPGSGTAGGLLGRHPQGGEAQKAAPGAAPGNSPTPGTSQTPSR